MKIFSKKTWLSLVALGAVSATISSSAFAGHYLWAQLYDGSSGNTYQTMSGSVRSVSQGYNSSGVSLCMVGVDPSGTWNYNYNDCSGIASHRAGLMESYAWACTGPFKGLSVYSECSHEFSARRNNTGNYQPFSLVGKSYAN
jgi:hypothetical protein